jgi:hypothetical protein
MKGCQKMNTISPKISSMLFGMDLAMFRYFMAKRCILLFFLASASKIIDSLIVTSASETKKSNRIQTNFDSNGAIRTFENSPTSKLSRQENKLFQTFLRVLRVFVVKLFLLLLNCYQQTESKGNFCLITVYSHKTFPQPQAIRAKKQTFTNDSIRFVWTA